MHVPLTGKYQDHYAYQSTDKTKSKNLEKLGTSLEWSRQTERKSMNTLVYYVVPDDGGSTHL
jgi:hypothetical protein